MPRGKKELAEQIIPKLREVEVEFATLIAHRGFDACGSAVDRAYPWICATPHSRSNTKRMYCCVHL